MDQQRVGERRVGQVRQPRQCAGRFGAASRRRVGGGWPKAAAGVLVTPVVRAELTAGQVDRRVGEFGGKPAGCRLSWSHQPKLWRASSSSRTGGASAGRPASPVRSWASSGTCRSASSTTIRVGRS